MNKTMKNISLLACSVLASVMVLSACAQTSVSVRPTYTADQSATVNTASAPRKQYEPLSRDEPYTVQAGDTLYGISFRAGLAYREVAAWNNIAEPYTVKVGQRLVLRPSDNLVITDVGTSASPTVETPVPTTPVAVKPAEVKPAETKPTMAAGVPVVTANTTGSVMDKPVAATVSVTPASDKPVPVIENRPIGNANPIQWIWPSEGTVISRYVQGDTAQQGINIGGKSGQAIKASSDGTVVYSGAGLVGYGELIIIKHSNEWLSAYAHNRRRLVAEGAKVKAGEVIAEMGRTGTIRDMLHFEIRRNGKPVDPMLYLPKP